MRVLFPRAALVALVLTIVPPSVSTEVESIPEVVDATVPVEVPTGGATATPASSGGGAAEAHRSAEVDAPMPFTMIGFELPDDVDTVRVRTATDDGAWSDWYELDRMSADDGPAADASEADESRADDFTEPAWVGESTRFQVEFEAPEGEAPTVATPATTAATPATTAVGDADLLVEATVLDTDGLSGGPVERRVDNVPNVAAAEAQATQPDVISREEWGAQAPRDDPSYAEEIDLTVVHHTAGSNDYTPEQSAGQVRGIQDYHRNTLGWSDVGYNVLVDRHGQVFEGRAGGLDQAVVGAHAADYNTGSFGISVMGNFEGVDAPAAAYEALFDTIAWKASIHGFDPLGTSERTYGGTLVRTVSGHQQVGQTACPGLIQDRMWQIREEAAARTG